MSSICPVASCRGRAFHSERALQRHTKEAHEIVRSYAIRQAQSFSYSSHQETPHSGQDGKYASLSMSSSLECSVCCEGFDTLLELNEHEEKCLSSECMFVCSDCHRRFKYLSCLYDHVDEMNCYHDKTVENCLGNDNSTESLQQSTHKPLINGSQYDAVLFFDGVMNPNPGGGFILKDPYGRTLELHSINILVPGCTKQEARYCALIKGLQCANKRKYNIYSLLVQGHSEVLMNLMNKNIHLGLQDTYSHIIEEKLRNLTAVTARMGLSMFEGGLHYKWIPERENKEAIVLAKRGGQRRGDGEALTLIS